MATPGFVSSLTINQPRLNSKSQYKGKIATAFIDMLNSYMIARSKQHVVSRSLDSSLRNFLQVFGNFFETFSFVE